MYGAEWCGACKKQKTEFGDAFEFINYVDCGPPDNPNPACINAGIGPIPDWVSHNGTHYTGYQNLTQLAQLMGDYRAAQSTSTVTPPLSPSPSIAASPTPTPPGFTATAMVTVAGVLVMYLLLKRRRE